MLLVEDDAEVRDVVRSFLEALGCAVVERRRRRAGAATLLAEATPFDLLLSDIALGPGMRGTELAARAQARAAGGSRVLLMSGFSAELLDADRDSPPDWELLRKPYSRAELARAIARVTGG